MNVSPSPRFIEMMEAHRRPVSEREPSRAAEERDERGGAAVKRRGSRCLGMRGEMHVSWVLEQQYGERMGRGLQGWQL